MKKISIVGVLVRSADWILHPIAYYKELQEYREDYNKEVLDFHKQLERLNGKLEEKEQSLSKISAKYDSIHTKLSEVEESKNELKQEIRNMKPIVRSLEQKLIYRNRVIESLRDKQKKILEQINELDKERSEAIMKCLELAKKVDFYEKQNKKSAKEKIDYNLMANKTVKRSKKNEF